MSLDADVRLGSYDGREADPSCTSLIIRSPITDPDPFSFGPVNAESESVAGAAYPPSALPSQYRMGVPVERAAARRAVIGAAPACSMRRMAELWATRLVPL